MFKNSMNEKIILKIEMNNKMYEKWYAKKKKTEQLYKRKEVGKIIKWMKNGILRDKTLQKI